jgi:hypothetical protein
MAEVDVRAALERFLVRAELSGQAIVRAELARQLADALAVAEPQSVPALARELQAALAGILPNDEGEQDDWTTRTVAAGVATGGDATRP